MTRDERVMTVLSLLFGTIMFSYMLSSVSQQIRKVDLLGAWKTAEVSKVREYLRWRQLPLGLSRRILRFHEQTVAESMSEARFHNEASILSQLSPSLRREAYEHLLSATVGSFPLLDLPSHRFRTRTYEHLVPLLYERHETILHKGAKSAEMYFLHRGEIEARATDGTAVFPLPADSGAYFGEGAFRNHSSGFTFVANAFTEVFYLPTEELAQAAETLLSVSLQLSMAESMRLEVLHKQRLRCWMLRTKRADYSDGPDAAKKSASNRERRLLHKSALTIQYYYLHSGMQRLKADDVRAVMPLFFDCEALLEARNGPSEDAGKSSPLARQAMSTVKDERLQDRRRDNGGDEGTLNLKRQLSRGGGGDAPSPHLPGIGNGGATSAAGDAHILHEMRAGLEALTRKVDGLHTQLAAFGRAQGEHSTRLAHTSSATEHALSRGSHLSHGVGAGDDAALEATIGRAELLSPRSTENAAREAAARAAASAATAIPFAALR